MKYWVLVSIQVLGREGMATRECMNKGIAITAASLSQLLTQLDDTDCQLYKALNVTDIVNITHHTADM